MGTFVLAGEVTGWFIAHKLVQCFVELFRNGAQSAALRPRGHRGHRRFLPRGIVLELREHPFGAAFLGIHEVSLDELGVVGEKFKLLRVRVFSHVRAVFPVRELHHGPVAVPHRVVVVHPQRLQVLDHAPLEVAGPRRLHRGVHQTLAASHAMEVILLRPQAGEESILDVPTRALG